MSIEKRRYERQNAVINGAFHSVEDDSDGEMIMVNISRSGLRASLKKAINPGRIVQIQIRTPEQNMPIFTTGRVTWVREKAQDLTYNFDVGIRLLELDSLMVQKLSEYDMDSWHLKQIADYAVQRGNLAKKFPKNSFKVTYLLPSIWLLYLISGAIASFLFTGFGPIYVASIAIYITAILVTSAIRLMREKGAKLFSRRFKLIWPVSAGRISSHIAYGLFFLLGLLKKRI